MRIQIYDVPQWKRKLNSTVADNIAQLRLGNEVASESSVESVKMGRRAENHSAPSLFE